jgi:DNA-binding NtrC family response regulator
MEGGRFRSDLYFRLSAAVVNLPPLRDRPRELPLLARHFLDAACARTRRPPLSLSAETLRELAAMPWPGNVRELKNLMEYLAATVDGGEILPQHLGNGRATRPATLAPRDQQFPNIYDLVREVEREWMRKALQASGGVQVRAAELIGMPLRTFVTKMAQYGLGATSPRARGPR